MTIILRGGGFLHLRISVQSGLLMAMILIQSNSRALSQGNHQPTQQQGNKEIAVDIVSLSHTDETDAALAFCREGVAPVPFSIQRKIAAAGIQVVVTPRTIYDDPEKSGAQIFTNGGTFDNAGGIFQSGKNRVLIPERAAWRNSPPRWQGRHIVTVVRHELGHALDHACGSISQQSDYIRCYKEDLHRLTSGQKIEFAYFITGTSKERSDDGTASGRGELFAQTFCALCTKPPLAKDTKLLEAFPTVKDYILSLEPELKDIAVSSKPIIRANPRPQTAPSSEVAQRAEANPDVDKAAALIQTGHYVNALRLLNGVIRAAPTDDRAHLLRGNTLSWLSRYREAINDYNAAIRLNRELADAYFMRGRAYGWLGRKLDQQRDEETGKRILAEQAK